MKEVAILLLVALMLNGCGSSTTAVQTAAGGLWQAVSSGGAGTASDPSFITQFTVGGNGSLSVSYFQFLNLSSASTPCFPVTGETPTGSITNLILNTTTLAVTADFSFTVQSGGNTLTLTGTLTGTENGTNGTTFNSGASITGTWTLTGGTGCNDTNPGSFTMTQS